MFEMGFRNSFMPVMGQGEEEEFQSLQQTENPAPIPTIPTIPTTPTPPPKPAGTSDNDWAKIIAAGLTAGAAGYGAYTKEQIAAINADAAKAAAAKSGGVPAPAGVGVSANTIFLVGGVAVVGIIAAIALK
jgi:hypothetical protein